MRKSGILFALLLGVACKGSEPVSPPVTTTVMVTSTPSQITVNETAQASAIVKDQNGNALTGKSITWTSLNQAVATVSSTGVIKGVAAGSATIQGSVDGVTGSATVVVVAPVASCTAGPTTVDLAVGEVRVLSASATGGCVKIATTGGSSQYVVIAANANSTPDDLSTYTIKSDEGETVPNTNLLANPYRVAAQLALAPSDGPGSLQIAYESRLRQTERRELRIVAGQRAYGARSLDRSLRMSVNAAISAVGDTTRFKVPKSCRDFKTITATVKYVSNRAILYTDSAAPDGGFTDTDFKEIGTEFDNLIYPTDVDYFGTPSDLDGNSRVIILYTPEVNKLTPPNNPGGFVGGFFFAGDLFPSTGDGSCLQSNVAEIFYVLAPDPGGTINGNIRTTAAVRQGTRGTIAHEFQHMINASERIQSPIEQELEDTWLDEALSHFAEDLNGRKLKNFGEANNLTFAQLSSNNNDYYAFFFQNFARFQRYLQNPGPNAPTSSFSDSSLADRGAAWALLRYTADHYAPGGDIKAFTRALAGGPNIGVNNLVTRAGGVSFDSLIAGWMVANYSDDAGVAGLATKYSYKTYDMRSNVAAITSSRTYPLVVNDIYGSGYISTDLQARSASGNYFRFTRVPAGPARSIRFLNTDGTTAASFTGATLYILRTQ
ncbi:MAG: Ig-like domain-containing protein [Gemmatimonadaceae bacterium]|nr:Ig-like domain-containing protein [Gemmatimonadaceae bacterium]